MDAVDAPKILIPEKIKKFASAAKTIEPMINAIFVGPELNTAFIEPLLKNTNGNMIIAVITELMNNSVIGQIPMRIL